MLAQKIRLPGSLSRADAKKGVQRSCGFWASMHIEAALPHCAWRAQARKRAALRAQVARSKKLCLGYKIIVHDAYAKQSP